MLCDIQIASGESFSISLPFSIIKEVSELRSLSESDSVNPTPEVLTALKRIVQVDIDSAAQGVMATVFLVSHILSDFVKAGTCGLDVRIKSVGLPIGAGLGSSAAFSVALSGALVRFKSLNSDNSTSGLDLPTAKRLKWEFDITAAKTSFSTDAPFLIPDEPSLLEINKYAFAAEVVIHGTPSGLDNTTSCFGGALKFSKRPGTGFDKLASLPPIHILLTNTRVPRKTSVLVGKVGALLQSLPSVVTPIFDSVEAISQRFLTLTEKANSSSVHELESEMVCDKASSSTYHVYKVYILIISISYICAVFGRRR